MDTMKLLLGMTVALLLAAIAVSWQGMKTGVRNTSSDELARLEKQIKELRLEQDKLAIERETQRLRSAPAIAPASSAAEVEAMRVQLEESKAAIAKIEADTTQRDAKLADSEELLLDQRNLEQTDGELRRARMISEALLIGRIREYVADSEFGGFVTLDVLMPDQVQPGTILAIRRKTGILGKLIVSEVAADGAIANPQSGFGGPVQPQVGDELILPPQY